MKRLIIVLLALTTNMAVNAQKGFKPLFDGKTTKGWHTYGKTVVGTAWKVEDGVLFFDPNAKADGQGGDLVTDMEYDKFHFKCDWKVDAGSNSGIIFLIQEDLQKFHNTYSSGLEMQILDNDGHKDGKIIKHRAGDLYDIIKSASEPVKPVGEWNTAEVIVNRAKLTLILNGVTVVETILWDDNFKKLLADSKFATWKDFGTIKKGKIAFQDHGNKVYFKNVMIKTLK